MALTFGYEFEVHGNGAAVLDLLFSQGAVPDNSLHEYHCGDNGCDDCDHENYGPRGQWLFSAQRDETVSAGFPSKVLTWGTEQAERAFLTMEHAAVLAGADLSGNSGMHVHVVKPEREGNDPEYVWNDDPYADRPFTTREQVTWRMLRIFVRYQDDLELVAHAGRSGMRRYPNSRVSVHDPELFWGQDLDDAPSVNRHGRYVHAAPAEGSWLEINRHPNTYEFRLWNAAKAAWRQRLAVGLSVAMVEAAMAGEDVTEDDPRSLAEVLHPYTDDETIDNLLRQFAVKGKV